MIVSIKRDKPDPLDPSGLHRHHGSRAAGHSVQCSACSLQELCLAEGLNAEELGRLDGLVSTRIKVKRGQALYKAGDPFEFIYPIRIGFFKTRIVSGDGREQIIGFPMPGDMLGFDAIGTGVFQSEAVALEDAEVCAIAFANLEELSREFQPLQQRVHRVFSREIVRDQSVMMLLGTMRAEERVCAFLLNLSRRFTRRGFSSREFVLRMTREEIGNYLGLKLETVSRTLSRLQEEGVIKVEQKRLAIVDSDRLQQIAACALN